MQTRTTTFSEQLESSIRQYARYVILDRALPDVRDGLKPVHRRILYAAGKDLGLWHGRPPKKSARIVGEVLGKYHPHGDQAVYEAMVRMAQAFTMQLPLIDGHGNFGSIDGDGAAAMRYTEARLSAAGGLLLNDIDSDTVAWQENFDDSLVEPTVLPAQLPNLLLNGSSGVAVAMSTNVPPHNLGELCDAIAFVCRQWAQVDAITVDKLLQYIQGPDFPTGGIIFRHRAERVGTTADAFRELYETGMGKITNQAAVHVEELGGGRGLVAVTELPYATRKGTILEAIGKKVREGKIVGVADVRDESDHTGIRVVIETLRGHSPATVLADLLQQTPLRTTFGGIMLALVPTGEGNETYPEYLSLKQCLVHFIQHRLNVIERRSRHERQKREERLHVVAGLLVALSAIDDVVGIIKKSSDREAARANLQKRLRLTERQAAAIVALPLGNLAGLEIQKLQAEAKELAARIKALTRLIESEQARLQVVGEETAELKKQYARSRRTRIMDGADMAGETITATDFLGPQIVSLYRDGIELRGAPGFDDRAGAGLTARRVPTPIGRWFAEPTWRVCAVSSEGEVWHCPVSQANGGCKGKSVVGGGVITSDEAYLVLLTKQGQIKRTKVTDLPRSVGAWSRIIGLEKGDAVLYAGVEEGETEIMLFTRMGQAIRMKTAETNPQVSTTARGVTAMKVGQGDALIAAGLLAPGSAAYVVLISENGYGKKVPLAAWPLQGRGGKGVQALNITPATGKVVAALPVHHGDHYVDLVTEDGRRQRLNVADVPEDNRRNRGAKLVDQAAGCIVGAVALSRELRPVPGAG